MIIEQIFFELIQVAIGTRVCLAHSPTEEEWLELFDIAKMQSLVGVCFAGVQKLQIQNQEPTEMLYLTWMGMAAKIQLRNEVINRQYAKLQANLSANGFNSAFLKGQGIAQAYDKHLRGLRQSGDIDVWVQNKSILELVEYVKVVGLSYKATMAHVECKMFDSTIVEFHAVPAFMRNFRTDRRLKTWIQEVSEEFKFQEVNGFYVPTAEFNLVYMMVHMYHHMLFDGLGLRQLMDYYYVLHAVSDTTKFQRALSNISSFGMMRFSSGIMWIMKVVFALEDKFLLCQANEKYGLLILESVMAGGNFGHHNDKKKGVHGVTTVGRSLCGLRRNIQFFELGTWEILSSPLWSMCHWVWRKKHGFL